MNKNYNFILMGMGIGILAAIDINKNIETLIYLLTGINLIFFDFLIYLKQKTALH